MFIWICYKTFHAQQLNPMCVQSNSCQDSDLIPEIICLRGTWAAAAHTLTHSDGSTWPLFTSVYLSPERVSVHYGSLYLRVDLSCVRGYWLRWHNSVFCPYETDLFFFWGGRTCVAFIFEGQFDIAGRGRVSWPFNLFFIMCPNYPDVNYTWVR